MKSCPAVALLMVALFLVPAAQAVTFNWATVGNPGNADDAETDFGSYGGVDHAYRISKHKVTNAQYTEFLNAVAATDSFGGDDPTLYSSAMASVTWGGIVRSGSAGSYTYAVKSPAVGQGPGGADGDDYTYANKPVVYVSFFDAMRFTNWLHNGQGSGDTETGVYNISDGLSETRSASAKFWVPSEDEWYKAAYYDPNAGGGSGTYYDYPTGTDTTPNNNLPSADTGNSANFFDNGLTTGNRSYPMTDVGAYSLSESPYGTFDQGSVVSEWNETTFFLYRGVRGVYFESISDYMRADFDAAVFRVPPTENGGLGFRVASIAVPGDYNNDGVVDGTDFLYWQRDPNVGNLADWEANYGLPVIASAMTVPEPSSVVLALMGTLAVLGLACCGEGVIDVLVVQVVDQSSPLLPRSEWCIGRSGTSC